MEIIRKNCKNCYEYNKKANLEQDNDLKIGLFRLRDDSSEKVLRAISEFVENTKKQRDHSWMTFLEDLDGTMIGKCQECEYISPLIYETWHKELESIMQKALEFESELTRER